MHIFHSSVSREENERKKERNIERKERKKITRIEGIRYDEGDLKRGCEARRKGEKDGGRKKGGG